MLFLDQNFWLSSCNVFSCLSPSSDLGAAFLTDASKTIPGNLSGFILAHNQLSTSKIEFQPNGLPNARHLNVSNSFRRFMWIVQLGTVFLLVTFSFFFYSQKHVYQWPFRLIVDRTSCARQWSMSHSCTSSSWNSWVTKFRNTNFEFQKWIIRRYGSRNNWYMPYIICYMMSYNVYASHVFHHQALSKLENVLHWMTSFSLSAIFFEHFE